MTVSGRNKGRTSKPKRPKARPTGYHTGKHRLEQKQWADKQARGYSSAKKKKSKSAKRAARK